MRDTISAEDVHQLFREVWPAPTVNPDVFWFEQIAVVLRAIRQHSVRPKPKLHAFRYGRLFVQHVGELRFEIQAAAALCRQAGGASDSARYTRCLAALSALDKAERAVVEALRLVTGRDLLLSQDRDPAEFLFDFLIRSWESLDGNVPACANKTEPIQIFIEKALRLAGI